MTACMVGRRDRTDPILCPIEPTRVVTVGCLHEHGGDLELCPVHHADFIYRYDTGHCRICRAADGHDCSIHILRDRPVSDTDPVVSDTRTQGKATRP